MAHILELPKFTKKNELGHTREFLRRLGDPQEAFPVVHVAGSNGKGSVCAFLGSVLLECGLHVGLFTSPHLVDLRERFRIDGEPCGEREFLRAEARVRQAVEGMCRDGLPHPTFFEYVFAVGMVIFAEAGVECGILETGLGGRLDATNIVREPILTVITSISLEHTEILGDTIGQIAAEKAGIIKPHVPLVYDANDPVATEVIARVAEERGAPATGISRKEINILLNDGKGIDFSCDCGYDVSKVRIPFPAEYQAMNGALALASLPYLGERFPIPPEAAQRGFARTRWPGRMEEACPGVYLDGAHNPAGIRAFLESAGHLADGPSVLLFSMVREKDYGEAIRLLCQGGSWERVVLTKIPHNPRALEVGCLRECFAREMGQGCEVLVIEDAREAFSAALSGRKPGQKLFCTGSLYLIGELERMIGGEHDDQF